MKKVIKTVEVQNLKDSYEKMVKLQKELQRAENDFNSKELNFITKYKKGYQVSSSAPRFTVEESYRRIVSWKWMMEKMWNKEVVNLLLESVTPTRFTRVKF